MDAQTDLDPILADVEAFLTSSGMTPTAFGHKALNDPTLVHELRRGRECKRATRARIAEYISSNSSHIKCDGARPSEAAA